MFEQRGIRYFRRTPVIILLLLCLLSAGYSQTGIPYITHFESQERYERYNWSVCQDDHNAMLFANRKGLRSYDGSEWHHIGIPHVPLKISTHPQTRIVYILSAGSAGYLQRDPRGIRHYVSLLDEELFEDYPSAILHTDNLVVFHGNQVIHGIDAQNQQVVFSHEADSGINYAGLIDLHGTLYTLVKGQGLFMVGSEGLVATGIDAPDNQDEILFSMIHNGEKVLTGMGSGNLYLFNGSSFTQFPVSNESYLPDNELQEGIVLNDTTYVFSTRYGGAVMVNKNSGKVINTLNYENGLPDNEIYAIAVDNSEGLWITYRFGICRLDLSLPVRDYSNYMGLEGMNTGILFHNDKLYISTTTGLYALSEVKHYEEVDVYIRRDPLPDPRRIIDQEKLKEKLPDPPAIKMEEEAEEEENKGFFERLFRRKSKKAGEVAETVAETVAEEPGADKTNVEEEALPNPEPGESAEPVTLAKTVTPAKQQPQYVKRTISRLKSIEHIFQKVEGIPGNCQHLVSTTKGILAGTSSGLFIVSDDQAELISTIRNINFINRGSGSESYLVAGDNDIVRVSFTDQGWEIDRIILPSREPFFSACETDSLAIWVSGLDIAYRLYDTLSGFSSFQSYEFESVYPEELTLAFIDDTLFLFSESMVQYYIPEVDSFRHYSAPPVVPETFSSIHLFPSTGGDRWIRIDNRILPFSEEASEGVFDYEIFSLFNNISSFHPAGENKFWVIDEFSGIYRIDLSEKAIKKGAFKVFIEEIFNKGGAYFDLAAPVFDPTEKVVTLRLTAPYYLKDNSTQYQYLIEDRMDQWSEWSPGSNIQLITAPGNYHVKVRARNVLGGISDPAVIAFTVRTPFYRTPWFYVILIPLFFGILFLIIYARERKLRRDNLILEQKIKERTREIQEQKEQIECQKDEILAQKNDITSSITYASKIQNAVLPDRKLFETVFGEYFIYYRPRDIVSGDFYWITRSGKKVIFAVADCTGHGVPGAFMSMLGNSFLNEIIRSSSVLPSTKEILNQLRDRISEALAQSGEASSTHDGMDIALSIYDRSKREIEFSGAFNSLYIVRNGEMIIVGGDKMPIGYHPKKQDFTSQTVTADKGDIIYLFTDGFPDQFGGAANKKYTIGRFKKLLVKISSHPMKEQKRILESILKKWQGNNLQVDDVLVMGLKL
jgi:serine phosphatase RsbU (regulator of sigma subunit)